MTGTGLDVDGSTYLLSLVGADDPCLIQKVGGGGGGGVGDQDHPLPQLLLIAFIAGHMTSDQPDTSKTVH